MNQNTQRRNHTMRQTSLMLLLFALLCAPMARADIKFTIVRMSTDATGPVAPGGEFTVVVEVRNDGDPIPRDAQGFKFGFSSSDDVSIGQPTGTPAEFHGYCPNATEKNQACECYAAFQNGQTMTSQAKVKVGPNAKGTVTITYTVSRGTESASQSVTVQIAAGAAPDATLTITPKYLKNVSKLGPLEAFELAKAPIVAVGEQIFVEVEVKNIGNAATSGQLVVVVNLQAGVWKERTPSQVPSDVCSDFVVHPSMLVATHTSNRVVPPNDSITLCFAIDLAGAPSTDPFATRSNTTLNGSVAAGGDVNASNNSYSTTLSVVSTRKAGSRAGQPPPARTSGRR